MYLFLAIIILIAAIVCGVFSNRTFNNWYMFACILLCFIATGCAMIHFAQITAGYVPHH